MQITKSFIHITNNKNYPVKVVDSYHDIEKFLNKAELLVVVTAGSVILEPGHIWNKLHSIPDDVGLLANLLQHDYDITPYFHEQFFILRTAAFKNLDFSESHSIGNLLQRSVEDMHGGWAPLYVTLENITVKKDNKFGTKLIEQCLENNFSVRNWDTEWRYPPNRLRQNLPSRGFCYPTRSTSKFESALKNLKVEEGLDEAQELFITLANELLEFKVLNAWNFEMFPKFKNLETVISPATGFLGEMTALTSQSKNLILYDTNPYNIEFKKHLYANWDGNDYDKFVLDWSKDKSISIEPLIESDLEFSNLIKKETIEQLFPIWINWRKSINLILLKVDILEDLDKILEHVKDNTLLYTSTIFTIYPMTHIRYSEQDILLTTEQIKNTVSKYNNCFWNGTGYNDNC
tara:strand:+ start:5441 stop:6652 length:1212 start_codon:yes stop_codon:yes gene_type:complete